MTRPSPTSAEELPIGVGPGMASRRLVVRAKDVVFIKGIIEAHDGLAHVFAERGGDLIVAAAADREGELESLVSDLAKEVGGIVFRSGEDAGNV